MRSLLVKNEPNKTVTFFLVYFESDAVVGAPISFEMSRMKDECCNNACIESEWFYRMKSLQ